MDFAAAYYAAGLAKKPQPVLITWLPGQSPTALQDAYQAGAAGQTGPYSAEQIQAAQAAAAEEIARRQVVVGVAFHARVAVAKAWSADQARGMGIAEKDYNDSMSALKSVSAAAAAVSAIAASVAAGTSAVPLVGQIAGAVAGAISFVSGIVALAKRPDFRSGTERDLGVRVFGGADSGVVEWGWTKGCYYFGGIPFYGPDFSRVENLDNLADRWAGGPGRGATVLTAVQQLVAAFPLGFPDDYECTVSVADGWFGLKGGGFNRTLRDVDGVRAVLDQLKSPTGVKTGGNRRATLEVAYKYQSGGAWDLKIPPITPPPPNVPPPPIPPPPPPRPWDERGERASVLGELVPFLSLLTTSQPPRAPRPAPPPVPPAPVAAPVSAPQPVVVPPSSGSGAGLAVAAVGVVLTVGGVALLALRRRRRRSP